ncbi:MAG TPA: hypothetical protein VMU14_21370 [Acidimicrobiales bacterium]|nr:hypothetical protein [Acidimicrobiales bacterium]
MSWRPTAVRNPLLALRRVVERPEIESLDPDLRAVGDHVTVPAPPGAVTTRRERARSQRAHPRPRPDRPVQALITSTPVEHTPAPSLHPLGDAHAPAGPWSTLPGAPSTTPTLLRAAPTARARGSTATATGRTATVTSRALRPAPAPADANAQPSTSTSPSPSAPGAPVALHALPGGPSTGVRRAEPSPVPLRTRGPMDRLSPAAIPDELPPAPVRRLTPRPAAEGGRRPMTVIQVVAAMMTALLAWALLDAPALLRGAQTAPRGARRTVALDVVRPLARVSAVFGIDRVSHLADDVLHRHHPSAAVTAPPFVPPAIAAPVAGHAAASPHATPTTVPALPLLRVGTAANPLRVLVIGDSLGLSFGYSTANKLDAGGMVKTTVDAREGTGLTRPDAFDWAAEVRADIVQFHPELVIAMFGGNDDQDTIVNGRFIPFGSQAWTVIYGARVAGVAATVHSAGAHLLWAGLPVMRSAALTQRLQAVMAVTGTALAGRDGAAFIDNSAALSDGSGHYTVALPGSGGQEVIVREPDGVHMTPAGADRLADRAIAAMATSWHLVDKPPAPGAQPSNP